MDEDLGEDDLIGKTTINLLPYFRHGYIDEWIKIFDYSKDWGDRDDMGEIRLIIDFQGPAGVRWVLGDVNISISMPELVKNVLFTLQVSTTTRFG